MNKQLVLKTSVLIIGISMMLNACNSTGVHTITDTEVSIPKTEVVDSACTETGDTSGISAEKTSEDRTNGSKEADATSEPNEDKQTPENEYPSIALPFVMDDGQITIVSIFTSDIVNPDCKNQEGHNLVTLQIQNTSGQFLENAVFDVSFSDGHRSTYKATDMPPGTSALLFPHDQYENDKFICSKIELTTDFSEYQLDIENTDIIVDDTKVSVSNLSGSSMNDVTVYCKCLIDDVFFGGITFTYSAESLASGESFQFDAEDCWLGIPEVVKIEINGKG